MGTIPRKQKVEGKNWAQVKDGHRVESRRQRAAVRALLSVFCFLLALLGVVMLAGSPAGATGASLASDVVCAGGCSADAMTVICAGACGCEAWSMGTGLNNSALVVELDLERVTAATLNAASAALHSCGKRSATVCAAELGPVLRNAVTCHAPIT